MDGLRSTVNAHALARRIADLVDPRADDADDRPYAWDAEDDELVDSSMRDMATDDLE
jgi:hypothetical protein